MPKASGSIIYERLELNFTTSAKLHKADSNIPRKQEKRSGKQTEKEIQQSIKKFLKPSKDDRIPKRQRKR